MMLDFIECINTAIGFFITVAYAYQFFFLAYGFINRKRKKTKQSELLNKYGVIICARNESNVIADLIKSLKRQNYPSELIDIYVVADNCTDDTADIARGNGAIVYERFNKVQVGKGYAMEYFFRRLMSTDKFKEYAGFFVFDADNIVDKNFVREMNNTFNSNGGA